MDNEGLTQYTRIAISLAERIASGQLKEGDKLSGRSKLSPEYNVSPETIRRTLRLLADMVPQGARLADIGTDHGYLPVWLMQQGRIASAIAADIGPEPLAHARRTAEEPREDNLVQGDEREKLSRQRQRNALETQLRHAVETENFEEAAKLRDQLRSLPQA